MAKVQFAIDAYGTNVSNEDALALDAKVQAFVASCRYECVDLRVSSNTAIVSLDPEPEPVAVAEPEPVAEPLPTVENWDDPA